MIERLVGKVVAVHPTGIVLDVNGVGYGVEMTDGALQDMAHESGIVTVWVHTLVREDEIVLFGFLTLAERRLFSIVVNVSGVGPRKALGVLARFDARSLQVAIEREDVAALSTVPGIGKTLAEKMLLELKSKKHAKQLELIGLAVKPPELALQRESARSGRLPRDVVDDLRSALENFGYKDKEYGRVVARFEQNPPSPDVAVLVKLALAELSSATKQQKRDLEDVF